MHQVTPRRWHATGIGLGVAVLLTALASCSASHGRAPAAHSAPTPTTAMAAPSASGTLDPSAQAALASYEMSWRVVDEAGRTGHYQLAVLSKYFAGDVLKTVTQNLDGYEQNGIVSKGTVALHPYVVVENLRSKPPTVTLADCLDDRNDLLYFAATGKLIDDVPGGFHAVATIMSDLDGTWKATTQAVDAEGTCKLR